MNIFRKIGALMPAGTMAFSGITVNAQYVSAENEVLPETLTITEKNHTGRLINSYSIDIDNDGIKEKIGRYHIDKIDYSASDFYYIDNDDSEPYIMFKQPWNDHMYIRFHIVQDNNTGETFFGYTYSDISESRSLHRLYPDGQEQFITGFNGVKYTDGELTEYYQYLEYMQNVTFLDEVAYSKGDIDGDTDITISDASTILSCYAYNLAGLPLEINDIQKDAADMDKDGAITISDASTALSLYAESAAGLIDTLILPSIMKEDTFIGIECNIESNIVRDGELESIFYLDIDNDGKKETIGRYDNTNLANTSGIKIQADPYVLQVYDNGKFYGTFGFDPSNRMVNYTYVLIADHNINETYLASITHRCAAGYGSASIQKEYPSNTAGDRVFYASYDFNSEIYENKHEYGINGNKVTGQELLDYIDNIEIISPYEGEKDQFSIFKDLVDRFGK